MLFYEKQLIFRSWYGYKFPSPVSRGGGGGDNVGYTRICYVLSPIDLAPIVQ